MDEFDAEKTSKNRNTEITISYLLDDDVFELLDLCRNHLIRQRAEAELSVAWFQESS